MNNFRGFTNTTISLRKVNFFVGENSTGKTSLIALLELLTNRSFWWDFDFNAQEYKFGGYKDIISARSQNKKEFQIGFSEQGGKTRKRKSAFMIHFRESKDGLPEFSRFSWVIDGSFFTINRSENQITSYLEEKIPESINSDSPEQTFDYLFNAPKRASSNYKKILSSSSLFRIFTNDSIVFLAPTIINIMHNNKEITKNERLLMQEFPEPIASMAPIRTTPKRTYDGYTMPFNPQGEHTPYIIRENLRPSKTRANDFKKALDEFGLDSALFESVVITEFEKGVASPFELRITLGGKELRVNSVGYGVSQALPIIVELLDRKKGSWLAFQQPEVHLHPKAQAALGELLYNTARHRDLTLIVETHSDYLIDRYRMKLREEKNDEKTSQVIFFERNKGGNSVYPMILDSKGEYPEDQPCGFRSFFLDEYKRFLGI